ncbi:MAG TPA: hypothetical protein VIT38_09620 [Allosphingosinicella sp.]
MKAGGRSRFRGTGETPWTLLLACLVAVLASCGSYPRDAGGTRERIVSSRLIRVGVVDGPTTPARQALIAAYLERLRGATGALPRIVTGAAEPLLIQLEADQLDLVVGEVARDSPWISEVTVIEPLAERRLQGRWVGLSPMARNGENAWIMLLEREAREMRAGS